MEIEKVIKGLWCHAQTGACSDDCPYRLDQEKLVCTCSEPLCADALALIREQQKRIEELEAAQTARVMTLEEVKANEVVYLEDFADPDDSVEPIIRPAINIEVKNGGIVMLDSATWDEGFIFNTDDEYSKTWRCWTQRPTDEQREAVKWG